MTSHKNTMKSEDITLSPDGLKKDKFSSYLHVDWNWHIEEAQEQVSRMYPEIISINGYINEEPFFWNNTTTGWSLRINDVMKYESIQVKAVDIDTESKEIVVSF